MPQSDYGIIGAIQGVASNVAGTNDVISTVLIPPCQRGGPTIYSVSGNSKKFAPGFTHVTTMCFTNGTTANVQTIMRPKNYTWLTTAIAANGTALVPYDDPGVYSTNYKWPSPLSTFTAQVANNAIATNDWVAIQLKDGTWHKSMIASGTFAGGDLVLTTAVPNVTGGGAAIGAPVYFFGIPTDKDPATGIADPAASVAAVATSLVFFKGWSDATGPGIVVSLHEGDPLLFYSPNTTALGTLDFISGFYAQR